MQYYFHQGLIEPKRQEGIQLNVNWQTAKCKALNNIHGRLQELTDIGGCTQRTCLKIVTVYILPFTLLACPLAAQRLDKPLLPLSQ